MERKGFFENQEYLMPITAEDVESEMVRSPAKKAAGKALAR
jgi:hypothetical protein